MNLDLAAIIIILPLVLIFVFLLVRKNRKDRKEMERTMNEDYNKPKQHESEHY